MTPAYMVAEMRAAGLRLSVDADGSLRVSGPKAAYSQRFANMVRSRKVELVEAVGAGSAGSAGSAPYLRARAEDPCVLPNSDLLLHRSKLTPLTPLTPQGSFGEVQDLQVRLLADLPAPFTLTLADPDLGEVTYSTARQRVQEARGAGRVAWAPGALETAAYAVQEGRAGRHEWLGWSRMFRDEPGRRLGAREALGQAEGLVLALERARALRPVSEPRITLGSFLRAVGARVETVEIEDRALGAQEAA